MSRWVEGSVVNLRQWTEELYSLQVRADIDPFIAGQFTRVAREIGGEIIARPYSFVNAPDNPVLEFYFITVPAGPLSHELNHLRPGDSILVAPRAAGFFILRELPDAECLWMLATGTAIGPFLSILGAREVWERFRNIILVHSVRSARELTYQDTLKGLLEQHPDQLQVIPMVSRESCRPRPQWPRHAGHRGWPARSACRAVAGPGHLAGHDLRQPGHGARHHAYPGAARTQEEPASRARPHHHRTILEGVAIPRFAP